MQFRVQLRYEVQLRNEPAKEQSVAGNITDRIECDYEYDAPEVTVSRLRVGVRKSTADPDEPEFVLCAPRDKEKRKRRPRLKAKRL